MVLAPEATEPKSGASPSPSASPLVLVEWRGPVVVLTLNNPPLNVLTTQLLEEMRARVEELEGEGDEARVEPLRRTGTGGPALVRGEKE